MGLGEYMAITYVRLANINASGTSTEITVNNISQIYDDLVIKFSARSSRTNDQRDNLSLFFNGDLATSNYYRSEYYAEDGIFGLETRSNTNTQIGTIPSNTAVSNLYGMCEIYIPSYSSTGNQKIAVSRTSQANRDATTTKYADWQAYVRYLANTNPITSISLGASSNLLSGSKINIYGIKNA